MQSAAPFVPERDYGGGESMNPALERWLFSGPKALNPRARTSARTN